MSRRTMEEFVRDYNATKKILRPNPDWEEDLRQTVEVTPEIEARIRTYTQFKKKREKIECVCQEKLTRPGVAPLIEMNDGHTIPSIGFGTWPGEGGLSNDNFIKHAVEVAIDAGYRHIDTAAIYQTEIQVGQAVANKIAQGAISREDMFITTKLWNNRHAKSDVIPALKESLAKLNMTYVDMYLMHWPVSLCLTTGLLDKKDYLDTWKGMIEAKEQGLTKSIGVSNFNIHQLQRLLVMSRMKPANLSIEVNLNIQNSRLIAFCNSQNIVVTSFTPMGSIFHNKAAKGAPGPRTDEPALVAIADRHHKTVAQIVLRYVLELGAIPIVKSITPKRIQANIEIFDFQLNQKERDKLKTYENNYRVIAVPAWKESPFYPFKEK